MRTGDYDARRWTGLVKPHRFKGERSERCWVCYEIRLEELFKHAVENGMDIVGTTLSISPHKDAVKINEIGTRLAQIYGIEFLEADFKKKGGFAKSVELSKEYGFYRQNYCGCVYSRAERDKKTAWHRRYAKKG